jgi:hypothetical protein
MTGVCAWSPDAAELALPSGTVSGVLAGPSRNASTTCMRGIGTGGPEMIYRLRISERALVDIKVTSTLDTVLALRRACDDPLTELACNDGRTTMDASGFTFSRDAHLRAVLEPSSYYLIVDEAAPFGTAGGPFVIEATASPPPPQASCTSAIPIQDGTHLPAEELDLVGASSPSCSGRGGRPALFYRASIPSGQRLTVRPRPRPGPVWTPVLQLFADCRQPVCLATDRTGADGQSTLRYLNNGPTDQAVLLSVSADSAFSGASFDLEARIAEPPLNQTCNNALALTDGTVLRRQDLSEAQVSDSIESIFCSAGAATRSLYYSATLLEGQRVIVTATPSPGFGDSGAAPAMMVRQGCDDTTCRSLIEGVDFTNSGPGTRTILIEAIVASSRGWVPPFDLHVSMPPPPAAISVDPTNGLQTTEAGGAATFQVALASPPLTPVTIPLASSAPDEATVRPATLRFDPSNWQRPQIVTVTGIDDSRTDGARAYQVLVGPASDGDERYQRLAATRVSLVNRDDEPGFFVTAATPLATAESGTQATFTVTLNRAPTATVQLPVTSSDPGEGTVSTPALVFEPQTWDLPRTIKVTGTDDPEQDGLQPYRILLGTSTSADAAYAGIDPDDLPARNIDDDFTRVASRVISGDRLCQSPENLGSLLAVDREGTLHAAMVCQTPPPPVSPDSRPGEPITLPAPLPEPPRPVLVSQPVLVATSRDGGRTFGAPVDTGIQAIEVHVASGAPGVVVVVGSGPAGLLVTRSTDGGATWQPATNLAGYTGALQLAAEGDLVLLSGRTPNGPALWISRDGGQVFKQVVFPSQRELLGLGVDPKNGYIWIAALDEFFRLRLSADGGTTFDPGLLLATSIPLGPFALTARTVFALTEAFQLFLFPRDGSPHRTAGTPRDGILFRRALAVDRRGNAFAVETDGGSVLAYQLPAGAESFSPPQTLGPSEAAPHAVALSANAVAVTFFDAGQMFAAIETWPAPTPP